MGSGNIAEEGLLTHVSPSYRCTVWCSSCNGGNDCTTGAGGLDCNGVGSCGNDGGPGLITLQFGGWQCFELSSPRMWHCVCSVLLNTLFVL